MSENTKVKFDAVLDMSSPTFAADLRAAIGAKPGERVEVSGPQFTRIDGVKPAFPQIDFGALSNLAPETLKAIGCQKWDEPDDQGRVLWLYPAEWYDHIPDGTPIVDINGSAELFKRGETDDDMRFGALAFGLYKVDPNWSAVNSHATLTAALEEARGALEASRSFVELAYEDTDGEEAADAKIVMGQIDAAITTINAALRRVE